MTSDDDRTARVTLSGDLDLSQRAHVESLLIVYDDIERVVIDCSKATSIDSTILTALMRYRRRFQQAGGDPVNIVVVVNPNIRRMFEVAGLSRVLTIVSAPALA